MPQVPDSRAPRVADTFLTNLAGKVPRDKMCEMAIEFCGWGTRLAFRRRNYSCRNRYQGFEALPPPGRNGVPVLSLRWIPWRSAGCADRDSTLAVARFFASSE
jgi:hypothetical protein